MSTATEPAPAPPKAKPKGKRRAAHLVDAAATRRPGYRSRQLIVLTALLVPDLFSASTGIHVHSSSALLRTRLIPALMMMRNRDRRALARCTWWAFAKMAAIEWGDPRFQQTCCRRIRNLLCCTDAPK